MKLSGDNSMYVTSGDVTSGDEHGAADAASSRAAPSSAKSRKTRQAPTRGELEANPLAMAVIKWCVLDVAALGAVKRREVLATCKYLRDRYNNEKTDDEIIGLIEEFCDWLDGEWEDKTPSPGMLREWWEQFTARMESQAESNRTTAPLQDYEKQLYNDILRRRREYEASVAAGTKS